MLAAAMVHAAARAKLLGKVPAELFVDDGHAATWGAMVELQRRGMGVDMPALAKALAGRVEPSYLSELAAAYPTLPVNLDHHVDALRWDHARSSAARGPLSDLLLLLQDPSSEPAKIRACAKQVALALDVVTDRSYLSDAVDLARQATDAISALQAHGVYSFGLRGFDSDADGHHRVIPGPSPGTTTLITGVSGSYKSVMCARIVLEQARLGQVIAYGAWEMKPGPTLTLLTLMSLADDDGRLPLGERAGWTRDMVSTGAGMTVQLLKQFRERAEAIGQNVKFFDQPFARETRKRYTNDDALDVLAQRIADSGCTMYALDLAERMFKQRRDDDERNTIFRLQHVAEATNSHGLLVAQQKLKEVEQRDDKHPTRATVFGSAAWVEIADTLIGTHYPKLWKPSLSESKLEVMCLKQRFGRWPFAVEFDWDPQTCQLLNGADLRLHYDPSAMEEEQPSANVGAFLGRGRTPDYRNQKKTERRNGERRGAKR